MDDSDTMTAASMGFVCYMNVVFVCCVFLEITCIHPRYFPELQHPSLVNLAAGFFGSVSGPLRLNHTDASEGGIR